MSNTPAYKPSVLPEWENPCMIDQDALDAARFQQLTDENAHEYALATSRVGWKKRVKYAMQNLQMEQSEADQDTSVLNGLLENLISTVILLASGGHVPDEYLINSYIYLRNVSNECGDRATNVLGILELLQSRASEEILSAFKFIDDNSRETINLPKNLFITRIPRRP